MNSLKTFFFSSIGKKMAVAVTGILLMLFVIGHLAGNLQVFLGPDWLNSYAHKLQTLGIGLWAMRIGLLVTVFVHIGATISLVIENRKARPQRYTVKAPKAGSAASRSMVLSGLIVLFFIIFHLLHYTIRKVPGHLYEESIVTASGQEFPAHIELTKHWGLKLEDIPPVEAHNTYGMMLAGFSYWYIAVFYVIAVGLLCLHLSHGASSFFQTLGLRRSDNARSLECGARIFAALIFLGYASIPIAILTGIVHP